MTYFLEKLEYYGIRDITSYLQNRKQFVQANGHSSPTQSINVDVPQASGLCIGPLTFNFIYK